MSNTVLDSQFNNERREDIFGCIDLDRPKDNGMENLKKDKTLEIEAMLINCSISSNPEFNCPVIKRKSNLNKDFDKTTENR